VYGQFVDRLTKRFGEIKGFVKAAAIVADAAALLHKGETLGSTRRASTG
jgi:hypothetical protein